MNRISFDIAPGGAACNEDGCVDYADVAEDAVVYVVEGALAAFNSPYKICTAF